MAGAFVVFHRGQPLDTSSNCTVFNVLFRQTVKQVAIYCITLYLSELHDELVAWISLPIFHAGAVVKLGSLDHSCAAALLHDILVLPCPIGGHEVDPPTLCASQYQNSTCTLSRSRQFAS